MFQNILNIILIALVVQNACASHEREKRFIGALKSWLVNKFDPTEKEPVVILPIPPSTQYYPHPQHNYVTAVQQGSAVGSGAAITSSQDNQYDISSLVGNLDNISPSALIASLHTFLSQNGIVPSPEVTRAGLRLFSNKEGIQLVTQLLKAGLITPYGDNPDQLANDENDGSGQASSIVEVKPTENIKEKLSNHIVHKYPVNLPVPGSHIKIAKPHHISVGNLIHKHHKHRLPFAYKVKTRLIPTGLTPALHTIKHEPIPPKEIHVIHKVEHVTPKPTPPPIVTHVEYELPKPPVSTPHLEYDVPEPPLVVPHLEYGVPSVAPSIFNRSITPIVDKVIPSTPPVQVPHTEYGVPSAPIVTPTLNYQLPTATYAVPTYVPPSVLSIGQLFRNAVSPYTFNASPINNHFVPPVTSYVPNYSFGYPHRPVSAALVHNGIQAPGRISQNIFQGPKIQYNTQVALDKTPSQHLNSLNSLFSTSIASLPSKESNSVFRVKTLNTWDSVAHSPSPVPQRILALPHSFPSPLINHQTLATQHVDEISHASSNQLQIPALFHHSLNQNQIKLPSLGNKNVVPSPNESNTYIASLHSLPHRHLPELEIVKPINVPVNHTLKYSPNIEISSDDRTTDAAFFIPSSDESTVAIKEEVNQNTGDLALVTTYVHPGYTYKQISHGAPLSLDATPPKIELSEHDPFLIVVPSREDKVIEITNKLDEDTSNIGNSIDAGSESAKIESIVKVEPEYELQEDSNATAAIGAQVESNTLQPLTPVRLMGFNNKEHDPRLGGIHRRRRYRTTQRPIVTEKVPTTIAPITEKTIDLFIEDPKPIQNIENNNLQLDDEHANFNKSESNQNKDEANDFKYREITTIVDGRPLILKTFQKPGYSFKIYSKTPEAEESEEIADDKSHVDEVSIVDQSEASDRPNDSTEPSLLIRDVNKIIDKNDTALGSPAQPEPLLISNDISVESASDPPPPTREILKPIRGLSRRKNNIKRSRGRARWSPEILQVPTEA